MAKAGKKKSMKNTKKSTMKRRAGGAGKSKSKAKKSSAKKSSMKMKSSKRTTAKKPGMMAGTTGEDGKYYFETNLNYHDYKYWAKFDTGGKLTDYGYLQDDVPDFFWTQHVKDPITDKWTGEGQAAGLKMAVEQD